MVFSSPMVEQGETLSIKLRRILMTGMVVLTVNT